MSLGVMPAISIAALAARALGRVQHELAHLGLGLGAGETVHRLAVLHHHHRGQAAHAELLGDHALLVRVHLGQQEGTLVLVGDVLQQWHQHLAGLAPVCPEINHNRYIVSVYMALKAVTGQFQWMCGKQWFSTLATVRFISHAFRWNTVNCTAVWTHNML